MGDIALDMNDPMTAAVLWIGGLVALAALLFLAVFAAGLVLRAVRGVFRFVFGSVWRFLFVSATVGVVVWTGVLAPADLGPGALVAGGVVLAAAVVWAWATGSPSPGRTAPNTSEAYECPECGIGAHPPFSCPNVA